MDPQARSQTAVLEYAREPGRSALIRVVTPAGTWVGGFDEDVPRPAASLVKLPLAMAVEVAMADGALDPDALVSVADLLAGDDDSSILRVLDPVRTLSVREILGITMSASDGPCARWLLQAVGIDAIRLSAASAHCPDTYLDIDHSRGDGPLVGTTTANDALRLLDAACDADAYPITSAALAHSIRNSRIPLGVTDLDVHVAHKTGTLTGVAHDVALLTCRGGSVHVAFLTEDQHDTLVTGYEMGLCVRAVLDAWGLSVARTLGAMEST